MTVRVHHLWDSPSSNLIYSGEGENSGEYLFELTNCPTSPDAYNALLFGNGLDWTGIPGEIDGTLCRNVQMEPAGPDAWRARVQYGEPKLVDREREKLKAVGDYRVAFSIKPTTFRHFVAKNTTRFPPTAPDFGDAINVNEEGQVEGVDAILPSLSIIITERIAGASITADYVLDVANLLGKYNEDVFMGHFPAGTIQFTAGDGALSFAIENPIAGGALTPQDRELSFEFLYSPNITGLTVGDITGVNKLGHQYMWILWQSVLDGYLIAKKPRAVYVQDIPGVEPASFAPLGLTGI